VPADTPATARASLHVLVDALPDADLEEARRLLSTLKGIDPASRGPPRAGWRRAVHR